MTSRVILNVFPIEYFIPGSCELMLSRKPSRAKWKAPAKSFMGGKQPLVPVLFNWINLENGQQPTGGTLMIPNFLAPSSYNVYINEFIVR